MMNERTFRAQDAQRLENPERRTWLPPNEIIRELAPERGANVADIGAGTGYFSLPLADAVGPEGIVFAVDFQPEMLDILRGKLNQTANVRPTLGSAGATGLEDESCGLAFLANVWHELDDHAGALREAFRILKPGGRLAILDWRADITPPPGPPVHHRIDVQRVMASMQAQGFRPVRSVAGEFNYLAIGRKEE